MPFLGPFLEMQTVSHAAEKTRTGSGTQRGPVMGTQGSPWPDFVSEHKVKGAHVAHALRLWSSSTAPSVRMWFPAQASKVPI